MIISSIHLNRCVVLHENNPYGRSYCIDLSSESMYVRYDTYVQYLGRTIVMRTERPSRL